MPKVREMSGATNSAHDVALDAYIAMSEEEQKFLDGIAVDLIQILECAERDMVDKLNAQMFDQEEYLALWALLPAKVRTAIKRGGK